MWSSEDSLCCWYSSSAKCTLFPGDWFSSIVKCDWFITNGMHAYVDKDLHFITYKHIPAQCLMGTSVHSENGILCLPSESLVLWAHICRGIIITTVAMPRWAGSRAGFSAHSALGWVEPHAANTVVVCTVEQLWTEWSKWRLRSALHLRVAELHCCRVHLPYRGVCVI